MPSGVLMPAPFALDQPFFLLLFHHNRLQALGVLDIDGLDVAVEPLLRTLLVVSLAGDSDS